LNDCWHLDARHRKWSRFLPVRRVLLPSIFAIISLCLISSLTLVRLRLTSLAKPRHLDHFVLLAHLHFQIRTELLQRVLETLNQRIARTRDLCLLLAHRELEIGNLLVQELTCLLCLIVLVLIFFILVVTLVFVVLIFVLPLEFAIELRGKLLIDVTVCFTIFTIFITFIAVGPTRCPCITGMEWPPGV
jgi:hypothetical protein